MEWGFRKKRTKEDWQIIGRKVDERKRAGKESNVYVDGVLIPSKRLRKEISRQGYITVMDQANLAQGRYIQTPKLNLMVAEASVAPSPCMPPGFQIRTPSDQPVSHLVFEELPILRFQETVRTFAGKGLSASSG